MGNFVQESRYSFKPFVPVCPTVHLTTKILSFLVWVRDGDPSYVFVVFATHETLLFPSQSFWGWLSNRCSRLFYLYLFVVDRTIWEIWETFRTFWQ